jgi:hypothetical protein
MRAFISLSFYFGLGAALFFVWKGVGSFVRTLGSLTLSLPLAYVLKAATTAGEVFIEGS